MKKNIFVLPSDEKWKLCSKYLTLTVAYNIYLSTKLLWEEKKVFFNFFLRCYGSKVSKGCIPESNSLDNKVEYSLIIHTNTRDLKKPFDYI